MPGKTISDQTSEPRNHLSRREFLSLALSATAAVAANACAPAATQAPAAVKKGGKLRVAHTGAEQDLDPVTFALPKYPIIPQLYNPLIQLDLSRNPQPELAESWQYAPDRSYIDFKLRQGVKFHSGKELAAEDVVYTLQRTQDPATGGAQLAVVLKGVKAEAVDSLTVRFNLPGPMPGLFDALDRLYIVEKGATTNDLAKKANGTGPFKLAEWRPSDICHMVRNENYFKSGKPVVDELDVQVIPDVASMLINLEVGSVDVAQQIPNQEHQRLRNSQDVKLMVSPNASLTWDLMFNVNTPPFNDRRVRQAFSWAADRKRFVDSILFGVGKPKSIPWPDVSLAYDAALDNYYQFDLDKAKSLLADAGLAGGLDAVINTCRKNEPDMAKFAEMYQADLAKIGVRLKLNEMDSAPFNDALANAKFQQLTTHGFGFGSGLSLPSMCTAKSLPEADNLSRSRL